VLGIHSAAVLGDMCVEIVASLSDEESRPISGEMQLLIISTGNAPDMARKLSHGFGVRLRCLLIAQGTGEKTRRRVLAIFKGWLDQLSTVMANSEIERTSLERKCWRALLANLQFLGAKTVQPWP